MFLSRMYMYVASVFIWITIYNHLYTLIIQFRRNLSVMGFVLRVGKFTNKTWGTADYFIFYYFLCLGV